MRANSGTFSLFLVFSALFLPLIFGQTDYNDADSNARVERLAEMKNIGGLAGWAAMGRGMSNAAVNGYPTEAFSEEGFDFKALINYLIPAIVMLGICLLFGVLNCLICPCFWCCRSCGNCGGSKPDPEGYTQGQRMCALVTMIIGLVMVSVGFIIGLVSNTVLNEGVDNSLFSVQASLADVVDLPDRFRGTFGEITVTVEGAVVEVFDLVRSIPESLIGPDGDLSEFVANTTSRLRLLQITFDTLVSTGTDINNSVQSLTNTFGSMKVDVDAFNQQVLDLANAKTVGPNYYNVVPSCLDTFVPVIVVNTTGLFPDYLSLLESIISVNLTDTADFVDNTFDTISQNATALIDEQFDSIQATIDGFLSTADELVNGTLSGTVDGIVGQVQTIQATIDDVVQQYVAPNNRWRNIIMAVLFSFNILAVLICVLGFLFKKSWIMTCSAVFSFILISLFWFLCALHLIIAAPAGKICDIYYKQDILNAIPPSLLNSFGGSNKMVPLPRATFQRLEGLEKIDFGNISSPLFEPQEMSFYVDLFYDGVDYCHNGGNLVTFLNFTDLVDISSYVDEFTNSVNFTELVDSVNFDDVIDGIDFTAGLNLTDISDYLNYLDGDYVVYVNLFENLALKNVDSTKNDTIALLEEIKANLTTNCLETDGDPNTFRPMLENDIQVVIDNYNSLNPTINALYSDLDQIRSQLGVFATQASTTKDMVIEIFTFVEGIASRLAAIGNDFKTTVLGTTIPSGIQLIANAADNVEMQVVNFTDCKYLADDLLAIINSLCINSVGGLDAIWVTCGFLGLMLYGAIVGIMLTAKRWLRADAMEQEFGEDYYQSNEYELPPMYSAGNPEKA